MNGHPRRQIVEEIRNTRKSLHMTQEELAELAGTKKSNISRLESGRYNPSLDFLIKIANCLDKRIVVELK